MVGDHFHDKWGQPPYNRIYTNFPEISRQEFEDLKKEVEEMKKLLIRAKEYDERTGQHDCEMEDKVETLKKIAKLVGVSLDDVFKK